MIRPPIFMYHHVSTFPSLSVKGIQVSPNDFEQQMRFLFQNEFRCLSLSEVATNWQQGKSQPERSFVLTFDDGYIDNFENAAPILKKFGFTATIFVVVKPVEDGNKSYLSWQKMRELARSNFIFGSHTFTHRRLSSLNSMTIARELRDSKKIIEDRLGQAVDLLAYPYADSNERIQEMACEADYHAACGVTLGHWGPFNLWRVPVNDPESSLTFRWKAHGMYYTYTWLIVETYLGRKMREFKRHLRRELS